MKRIIALILLLSSGFYVYAHGGRIDSKGGHYASDGYHYHKDCLNLSSDETKLINLVRSNPKLTKIFMSMVNYDNDGL